MSEITKRVLVLCQRKEGRKEGRDGPIDIKKQIVPLINDFVENVFPDTNTKIEYLSSINADDFSSSAFSDDPTSVVDFNIKLERCNSKSDEFISNHKGIYSLIILHECPFCLMDYELIHSLLETDGLIVFKSFTIRSSHPFENTILEFKDIYPGWSGYSDHEQNIAKFYLYFEKISLSHPYFSDGFDIFYRKKTFGSREVGGTKKKFKKTVKKYNLKKNKKKLKTNKRS